MTKEYKKEKQFFQNECVFSKIGKMFCTMFIICDVCLMMVDFNVSNVLFLIRRFILVSGKFRGIGNDKFCGECSGIL